MTEWNGRICKECGDEVSEGRWTLGYRRCLKCGEAAAKAVKHCSVPMHKGGLIYVSPGDLSTLVGINCKSGQVK